MKFISMVLSLSIIPNVYAKSLAWDKLEIKKNYKLTENIILQNTHKNISISKGTSLELYEKSKLNMIKVYLYKYKIANCLFSNMETDLTLVPIKDSSVGVNLTPGCKIEIFVDFKDYKTISFLK